MFFISAYRKILIDLREFCVANWASTTDNYRGLHKHFENGKSEKKLVAKSIKPIFLNTFRSILFWDSAIPEYEQYLYLHESYIVFYFGI